MPFAQLGRHTCRDLALSKLGGEKAKGVEPLTWFPKIHSGKGGFILDWYEDAGASCSWGFQGGIEAMLGQRRCSFVSLLPREETLPLGIKSDGLN